MARRKKSPAPEEVAVIEREAFVLDDSDRPRLRAGQQSLARRATVKLNVPRISQSILDGRVPFEYQSPSTLPKLTMKQKIERGCRFTTQQVTSKKTGRRYSKRVLEPGQPDYCKPYSAPCGTGRKGCPVQLVFEKGKPALRFCFKAKSKGFAKRFSSVDEAAAFSAKACACWTKHGSFDAPACKRLFDPREGLIGTGRRKRRKPARKR